MAPRWPNRAAVATVRHRHGRRLGGSRVGEPTYAVEWHRAESSKEGSQRSNAAALAVRASPTDAPASGTVSRSSSSFEGVMTVATGSLAGNVIASAASSARSRRSSTTLMIFSLNTLRPAEEACGAIAWSDRLPRRPGSLCRPPCDASFRTASRVSLVSRLRLLALRFHGSLLFFPCSKPKAHHELAARVSAKSKSMAFVCHLRYARSIQAVFS